MMFQTLMARAWSTYQNAFVDTAPSHRVSCKYNKCFPALSITMYVLKAKNFKHH